MEIVHRVRFWEASSSKLADDCTTDLGSELVATTEVGDKKNGRARVNLLGFASVCSVCTHRTGPLHRTGQYHEVYTEVRFNDECKARLPCASLS